MYVTADEKSTYKNEWFEVYGLTVGIVYTVLECSGPCRSVCVISTLKVYGHLADLLSVELATRVLVHVVQNLGGKVCARDRCDSVVLIVRPFLLRKFQRDYFTSHSLDRLPIREIN